MKFDMLETHWKLHKITLKVVCVPLLGVKSLTSGKFVFEIRHFELWRHSSLRAYFSWQLGCVLKATASFESSYIHQEEACRIVMQLEGAHVLRTTEYRCTSSPQTRLSPANSLKRYAYIARTGQVRPPPDFAACISPVTAMTGKQLWGTRYA